MTPPRLPLLSLFAMLTAAASPVCGADYLNDVKPLLQHKCYACHASLKQQGSLRLDTGTALLRGGDSGAIVAAGKPDESYLIDVLTGDAGFRMPPANEGAPLTDEEIELIRNWISAGASVPDDEQPQADPRAWWSYQPIRRPQPPVVRDVGWCRNDIDRFVAAAREGTGLPHAAEAPKDIWLRRVFLDLIGLPPTRAELHAFLADESPDAHERVVDDLLDRPQYGERWGRHWMDVWRYSDWYGSRGINEIRYSQRHIWRWRDWIVKSLNDDTGYDRIIREMLAADELSNGDFDALPATGYLGRNWYKFDRDVWLFETVERTGEAFLGLTFRCCRCHDHKFDPVTQEEYYRFRAFFEPHDVRTDPVSALTPTQKDATLGEVLSDGIALVYDKHADAKTYRFERGDNRYPDKSAELTAGVPAALGGDVSVTEVNLPPRMWYPMLTPELQQSLLQQADAQVSAAETSLAQKTAEAELKLGQAELDLAQAQRESTQRRLAADVAKFLDRADDQELSRLAKEASAAELEVAVRQAEVNLQKAAESTDTRTAAEDKLATARKAAMNSTETYTPVGPQFPQTSTGRRSALAAWIASDENPRTARVAANHIWGRHFSRPLVETPENFGLNGKPPTHPQLLDWLAAELIASDWRMKPLHRQIVLSATYRMASNGDSAADPDNRLLVFWTSRRMEAEVVRDSVLSLAGRLDLTPGGPELPESESETILRRSLYFRNTPNEKVPLLEVFDVADPNACYRRKQSVVPHQSLALMNSGLAIDSARLVCEHLIGEADFVTAAFETVLSRRPTSDEHLRCRKFLAEHPQILQQAATETFSAGGTARQSPAADPSVRARENLIHVLFLHNDFVTIR